MSHYRKGILVMDYLQSLGVDMTTIGLAIDDQKLDQSYKIIMENPKITKEEFLQTLGISED